MKNNWIRINAVNKYLSLIKKIYIPHESILRIEETDFKIEKEKYENHINSFRHLCNTKDTTEYVMSQDLENLFKNIKSRVYTLNCDDHFNMYDYEYFYLVEESIDEIINQEF